MIDFYMYIMYTYREVPLPPVALLRPLHVPPAGVAQVLDALKAISKKINNTFPTFVSKIRATHFILNLNLATPPRRPASSALTRASLVPTLHFSFTAILPGENKKIKTGFHEKTCGYI